MEAVVHTLVAVFPGAFGLFPVPGPGQAFVDRNIEDDGEVGLKIAKHQPMEFVNGGLAQVVAISLIGDGGIGESVAQDPSPCRQCRFYGCPDVLQPGGEIEQRLGHRLPAINGAFNQKASDNLGRR